MIKKLLKTIYRFIPISHIKKLELKKKFIDFFPHLAFNKNTDEYLELCSLINSCQKKELLKIKTKPPQIKHLDSSQLKIAAESLSYSYIKNPMVSILIPVYNNIKLTLECLYSIKDNTGNISYEIIIIDDESKDETQQLLFSVKGIIYLRNHINIGFLRSCNLGLQKAKGEYVVILNNDIQVTQNWLNSLIKTFYLFPDTGAAGPKVLFPDGKLQEAGGKINRDATTQLIGNLDDPNKPQYNFIRVVDYCSACCLMLKTETATKLKGFDSSFAPAYSEDVDLCIRLQKQGLKIRYNPNSIIIHHLNATMKSVNKKNKLHSNARNQQKLSEYWQKEIDDLNKIYLIASYFPKSSNLMKNEIELAKYAGIYGFFIQHDLTTKNIEASEKLLNFAKMSYPFCFCLLITEQMFSQAREINYQILARHLDRVNYIKINKKPLLLIDYINPNISTNQNMHLLREILYKNGIKEIVLAYKISSELILNIKSFENQWFDFLITPSANQIPILFKKISKNNTINNNPFLFAKFFSVCTSPDELLKKNIKLNLLYNFSPIFYQIWLEKTIKLTFEQNTNGEHIIFIDHWHQNSEYNFLEATRNALNQHYLLG